MTHGPAEAGGGARNGAPPSDTPRRTCRFCEGSLAGLDHRALYCSTTCRERWWQRARVRGAQAYSMLIDWRLTRGGKKGILGDLAHLVDKWIQEDRA